MWDGIQLWGNRTTVQTVFDQPNVFINANSTIENARYGILADKAEYVTHENIINEYQSRIKDLAMDETQAYGGGYVYSNGGNFRNNRFSIVLNSFTENNESTILNSYFLLDDQIHDFDVVNGFGNRKGINTFIKLFDVFRNPGGLIINGNNFHILVGNILEPFDRGKGIGAFNSTFQACNNIFLNLNFGLIAGASNSLNTFTFKCNSLTDMVHGAFVSGIDYFQMHNNNIHVNSNFSTYGIYMENCTGYMLENNTLDYGSPNWFQNPVGIINYFATVNNNQNEIRNNEITNFKYSMLLEGEHRSAFNPNIGLELWCNSLKSYSKAISVTVPPGIAGIQDGPSPTTGANNLFEPYGCNFSNEGELYNPSGNNPFNYMHKLNSTTDFVEPVSGCFTATQVIPTAIQNVFDYPQDCASTTPDCNPVWRLIEPIASTNNNPVLKVSNVALIQPVFELEINKRIRYYLHDSGISNPEDSIIRLIKTTNTLGRDYLLAFAYAKIGQDSNLNIQLNSLNNDSVFTELNTISLLTDSVDWDKLKNDPARKSNLIETAMDSSKYAYTSARNVLRYVYDETFPEIIILPSTAIFQPKIARNMESSDLKIYPNPFTSEFNIELKNSNELFTLKIYNPLGVELMSISILGNKINTINFLDWPSGLYLLNIIGTEKFVFNGMINHVSK